jgi:FKBP-type peptidyl-prolyl cis-trans isomerase SlyD
MVIEKDRVVTIDYELKSASGEVLDSSKGSDPLVYLHGNENIIPGLERQLLGKAAGDQLSCVVPAVEAYGERDEELIFEVSKAEFGDGAELEVGMQFHAHAEEGGSRIVTVLGIDGDKVKLDANHPLAGEELHFSVKVVDVREATADEISHGHIHQECGCGGECGEDCGDEECGCGNDGGCGCH